MAEKVNWRASLMEHRVAWISACVCLLLIIVAASMPELFKASPVVDQIAIAEVQPKAKPVARSHPEPEVTATAKPIDPPKPVAIIDAASKPKPEAVKPAVKPQPVTTPVPKPKVVTTVSSSGYFVQLGAFSERARAAKVIDQLKANGFSGQISPKRNLFAVWAGPEKSKAGAEKLKKAIAAKLKTEGFIVHNSAP